MKKNKLKFLILALLGLAFLPTTNAYELGNQSFWGDSWTPPAIADYKGMCLHYSRDLRMTFDWKTSSYSSISSNNTSCPEWAILGNFFSPQSYWFPWNQWIYNNNFSYVNSKKNGEWMDMIRTVYQNWEHKTVIITLPSRTAYKRTSNAGIDYMFTQIYFYHNQFILYDPVKEFWLWFLGKMNVVGGAVFANPWTTEDNLRFVDYIHKKAYSATITNTAAWKWLLGTDVSMSRLQSMNWGKSYTMNKGGSSFLPPNFKIDKQGSEWFQYIEDIEFTSPERWQGNSSNQNNVAENYNKCVNYYSDIKNLAYYSQKCWEDPADDETLNRVKVDSWNAEAEAQTVIDQLTLGNKAKCWRFAKAKKQYKNKYGVEFENFYKDFWNYARTPEAVDVQSLCKWIELEHWSAGNESWFWSWIKDWFEWMRDKFRGYSGNPIGVYSGKNYYEYDFNADLSDLKILYDYCKWFWSSLSLLVGEETMANQKKRFCEKYENKRREMEKIYGAFSWYVGLSGTYLDMENNPNDDVGLWKKFVSVITDPFYSGYNSINLVPALCSWFKDDFFDIFFYLFYFWVVFYLFKLFV